MIKWFLYIVLLIILVPRLSSAEVFSSSSHTFSYNFLAPALQHDTVTVTKTVKHTSEEDKKKIKEVAKAKKLPKPEKVDDAPKQKAKRQRRPDGLERPPEIPRRNN
ncbi:hypothetical protein FFF34_011360 [Inquilinus sp. KBS0705]|nr:hypothetical protein FFF34_011360 [Inquilinus sp. KBS0705]